MVEAGFTLALVRLILEGSAGIDFYGILELIFKYDIWVYNGQGDTFQLRDLTHPCLDGIEFSDFGLRNNVKGGEEDDFQ